MIDCTVLKIVIFLSSLLVIFLTWAFLLYYLLKAKRALVERGFRNLSLMSVRKIHEIVILSKGNFDNYKILQRIYRIYLIEIAIVVLFLIKVAGIEMIFP